MALYRGSDTSRSRFRTCGVYGAPAPILKGVGQWETRNEIPIGR